MAQGVQVFKKFCLLSSRSGVRVPPGTPRRIPDAPGDNRDHITAEQWLPSLNQDFENLRVPEKTLRTGARAIGAGLEDDDQIAGLRIGKFHPVA